MPLGINSHIDRRPIAALGNSDGDQQMLEWTTIGRKPSFGVIVHHTHTELEWACDCDSHFGHLNMALDAAKQRGWILVDMQNDWKVNLPIVS